MKATKKILSLVLALMMVLSSVAVLADEDQTCEHVWPTNWPENYEQAYDAGYHYATCEMDGYWDVRCMNGCNATSTLRNEGDLAKGHDWPKIDEEGDSAYVEYTEPTCGKNGYWTLTCKREGCNETSVVIAEKTATAEHDYDEILSEDKTKTFAATCNEAGQNYYELRCKNCPAVDIRIVPVAQLKHDWSAIIAGATEDNKECTGLAKGVEAQLKEENGLKVGTIKNAGADVKVTYKKAVCKANGSFEAGYVKVECPVCNDTLTLTIKAPTAHNAVLVGTDEPACEKVGYNYYKCSDCGYTWKTETPALEHDFSYNDGLPNGGNWWGVQNGIKYDVIASIPKCSPYTIVKQCKICGKATTEEDKKADKDVDHHWEVIYKEVPEDCLHDGKGIYMCTVCKATKTDVIPALGEKGDHKWVDQKTVTAPTCTEDGLKIQVCENGCKDADGEPITREVKLEKLGHAWDPNKTEKFAGDCYNRSFVKKTCISCGISEITYGDFNHMSPTVIEKESKKPTCEEDGYQTITCSLCNNKCVLKEFDVDGNSLKKTEHAYEIVVKQQGDGCTIPTEKIKECKDCGAVDPDFFETDADTIKGVHSLPEDTSKIAYEPVASCKGEGTKGVRKYICPVCRESISEEYTVEHDWEVKLQEDGTYKLVCKNCNDEREIGDIETALKLDSSKLASDNYLIITGLTDEQIKNGIYARITWSYTAPNGDDIAVVASSRAEKLSDGTVVIEVADPTVNGTLNFRSVIITDTKLPATKRPSAVNKLLQVGDVQ